MTDTNNPPPLSMACVINRKQVAATITCQGDILEWYIKATPQGVHEILPGYISPILGVEKDGDPPTALAGMLQIPFGLI